MGVIYSIEHRTHLYSLRAVLLSRLRMGLPDSALPILLLLLAATRL
jgi:hypothetical protein